MPDRLINQAKQNRDSENTFEDIFEAINQIEEIVATNETLSEQQKEDIEFISSKIAVRLNDMENITGDKNHKSIDHVVKLLNSISDDVDSVKEGIECINPKIRNKYGLEP